MNTPQSLSRRADFFRRLGQTLAAGIPIVGALEDLHRHPPSSALRPFIGCLLEHTRKGGTLADGFRAGDRWTNSLETALIDASERGGSLDRCLLRLAESYEEQARQLRHVWYGMAYPAFIIHVAVLLAPLPALVLSGDFVAYARAVLFILTPLYALTAGVAWVFQGRHGETWRRLADGVLSFVPVLGHARRSLALARLADTLDLQLAAGVGVIEAWPIAAAASGSPALQRRVGGWAPRLAAGETPAALLDQSPEFPHLFTSHYRTGEESGSLDTSLGQLRAIYLEEGNRRTRVVTRSVPVIVYLLVMLAIAAYIIRSWMGHYGRMFQDLGL